MLRPDIFSAVVIISNSIGTMQSSQTYIAFVASWCIGYHYCTISFNRVWSLLLPRLKSFLRHVGIRDGEGLWKLSRLKIKPKVFRGSTISQKQLIIVIIATKTNVNVILTGKTAKTRRANMQTKKTESFYVSSI